MTAKAASGQGRIREVKEKIKEQEKTYSRLQFQQEALYQHLERVQKDRDDVYEKFSGSVYEVRRVTPPGREGRRRRE